MGGKPAAGGSGSGGFALIEALASLVIVGLLAVMLIQGVSTGRRVWQRLDTRAAAFEAVEGAQTALRGRLEQIYPATIFNGGEAQVDVNGGPESLAFLAPPAEALRPAPLRRFRLDLTDGQDLVLSSVSDVALAGEQGVARQVLLTGVRQLDIAYYGTQAPDTASGWRATWAAQPALPELIRVRIAFEPGDPRWWPDLIVRPRTTVDAQCILSPATGHCRGRG
ncbi:MAG: PulJ/GspJ family protein [Caulobacteraceae bacterium]